MTTDRRRYHLTQTLIRTQAGLAGYLQMRQAKGYMSVSENDALRDNLFALYREIHDGILPMKNSLAPAEREAWRQTADAIASAVVCLMTGEHDSPSYITVNVGQLTDCLKSLTRSIARLNALTASTHA
ncbi:transcriptional regulator [Salmonella enterica]|nr:transcriptional regulator [Salmonella enterica]ECN5821048.1 biofilm formation regulator BssR [Salmonella enterica subsp. enterica serovar Infantis]EDW6859459.1 biofilm formation regulator BssR [Salmonella enterica]EEJ5736392.1 biofilm formation regulator BssR [Salmonella enterica]